MYIHACVYVCTQFIHSDVKTSCTFSYIQSYILLHCTTEQGDRVVENFSCTIIVIIKFVDQDIIEFLSSFLHIYIYVLVDMFPTLSCQHCIVNTNVVLVSHSRLTINITTTH